MQQLQKQLEEIKANHYAIDSTVNIHDLSSKMLQYIGVPDGYLRDKLIYTAFYHLITNDHITNRHLQKLLSQSISEQYLFYKINTDDTDAVFTRSFTTLLIALIINADTKHNFLSQSDILDVKDKLMLYMDQEHDFRGYVNDQGWAHSIAHVSDTFDELVQNPKLEASYYPEILQTLLEKINVHTMYYKYEEDERIITPIIAMLKNGLDEKKLFSALHSLVNQLQVQKPELPIEPYEALYGNIKSFLRSLFFRLRTLSICKEAENEVENLLKELRQYY
ncbi:hypothetical protein CN568_03785 [Bacillus pseudomycoides]|uniref:DUF2785 domain-containing protein n=1 Tax=Bacillus pseudomycoides TaxID=64104 RepID=UPI000BF09C8C|nr:DUF2785 domain-containing protein [Bacillus pseudomycoides]PEK21500.1 hypothetical protein CN691_26495 [Bacillus pseudomycoides]PEK71590.1 hypothetical protein CN593_03750 [Bacillus pseudomycoides]PEP45693.1 hypothetical protein CN565_02575 [Bacillus pseudomycoides]PEP47449.1 hypothetical protein CN568_03785 [Bacillus pseudomycoides]PFX56240.1 hypothetical protein COL31_08755 [Bacillus pseudomycoides]